jgi:hypothetical protein
MSGSHSDDADLQAFRMARPFRRCFPDRPSEPRVGGSNPPRRTLKSVSAGVRVPMRSSSACAGGGNSVARRRLSNPTWNKKVWWGRLEIGG